MEKEPRRFLIEERSVSEKGTWTRTTPSAPATSRRGQIWESRGSRFRGERLCELTGEERSSEGGEDLAERGGPGLE